MDAAGYIIVLQENLIPIKCEYFKEHPCIFNKMESRFTLHIRQLGSLGGGLLFDYLKEYSYRLKIDIFLWIAERHGRQESRHFT
jgi:hypothetical protein